MEREPYGLGPEADAAGDRRDRVQQWAEASDDARVYQAAGNQYFSWPAPRNVWGPGGGPAPRALASLPPDPAPALAGREERTAALLKHLGPEGPAVTVVTGLPGVGKTALALHTAHRAVGLGLFPGGTLFVRLRGYAPTGAVDAAQALEALLRALGVRDADLPPTPEEQAALYRSELARRAADGGAVLIVADDASSAGQLVPLVPAHPAHRLLVTSRDALTAPDFRPRLLPLGELDAPSAAALIATALAEVDPGDPRAGDEPEALERVTAQCGRLPLALTIAAALLTYDPGLRIADLAHELSDAGRRLGELRYEDGDGRAFAVRTAFDLSYRRLRESDARLFRLLSLNPGPDVSTEAATALTGRPARETRAGLAALARACLLGEHPPRSGRWRMHDLLRLYASGLPADRDEREARGRLMRYYLSACEAADVQLRADPGLPSDRFPDRAAALAWLEAERPNLVATVALATAQEPQTALRLAAALSVYLRQSRHLHDTHAADEYVVAAALRGGTRVVLKGAGPAWQRGPLPGDGVIVHSAVSGAVQRGVTPEELVQARKTKERGQRERTRGHVSEAVATFREAVDTYRLLGHPRGEGRAQEALGLTLHEAGRHAEAATAYAQAFGAYREAYDLLAAATALDHLGLALGAAGRHAEAAAAHIRAAVLFRGQGDPAREAAARRNAEQAARALRGRRADG
ncbi:MULTISPECIES: ATP-binding protein [Streptomyces]|uniref:ATP-binding protein n=2 Tax=Streptomyces TaxID=1883 RepID=A0ABU4KFP9_9ACTN|nr:ATP-binding protein [Streptomyces roseolus]MDX2296162.1 ATP-binding protein [Streptomyces roseolus]